MIAATKLEPVIPVYFDTMIESFYDGRMGRCAHLGHWTDPPDAHATIDCDFAAAQQRMDTHLIKLADLRNNMTVLDVGCGFGGLLSEIDARHTGMSLTGINVDPRQLEICHTLRTAADNALRWQEADACSLPYEDASFDRVFCVEAMFHFASRRTFLSEVARVLNPGGRLIASDIVLTQPPQTPRFLIEAILNDGYGPWPDPWCRAGQPNELCAAAGLRVDAYQNATEWTRPTYRFIVASHWTPNRDPSHPAARSLLLLQWLHENGHLRYEYLTARKAAA